MVSAFPNQLSVCFPQSSPLHVLPFSVQGEFSGNAEDFIQCFRVPRLIEPACIQLCPRHKCTRGPQLLDRPSARLHDHGNQCCQPPHRCIMFIEFIHMILETISTFTCRSVWETIGLQALSSVVGYDQLEQPPSP